MFPYVSVMAIAEDLMKTNNNLQRTIENILNGARCSCCCCRC